MLQKQRFLANSEKFFRGSRNVGFKAMITFPRRVPHKRSVPGGDDPDENIALVLFEEGSIARWHTAAVRKLCGKVIVAGFNTRG